MTRGRWVATIDISTATNISFNDSKLLFIYYEGFNKFFSIERLDFKIVTAS